MCMDRGQVRVHLCSRCVVIADGALLDNRPHWFDLHDECDDLRFGRRPRTGTVSSSDSAQSSTSSHRSRRNNGQPLVSARGSTGGPLGAGAQEAALARYRYQSPGVVGGGGGGGGGGGRTMSDSEDSVRQTTTRHYENLMCRELSGHCGSHVFKSDQQLSESGSYDVIEQRRINTDDSRVRSIGQLRIL